MKFKVYNTLTREKEEFIPLMEDSNYKGPKKDFVGIYSCGPTVYRDAHIGNMRAYYFADLLRNSLKNIIGYKVKYIVNITDVGHLTSDSDHGEDKLEKGSKREGISVWDIAKKYEERFHKFLSMLNIEPFDVFPRATDNIPEQIDIVKHLEEKGYTYIIDGDGVYMDTSKVSDYGSLAKLDIEGLDQGARIENNNKKNKTDFALRKFSPENEQRQMERESPRGKGFPGRHIECSAMSSKYLGQQFDIHTGGVDHIPVHHTNEIAQSECAFGVNPRVKYRMHNQFLNLGGKKISKSEGGLVTIDDVVEKGFDALDMRYFYMLAHYRNFQDFNLELLEQAKSSRNNLIKKIQKLFDTHTKIIVDFDTNIPYPKFKEVLTSKYVGDALEDMVASIMDDLNTPQLLAILNQSINSLDKVEEVDMKEFFIALYRLEKNLLKIGLFDWVGQTVEEVEISTEITQLADERLQAKKDKNFTLSDELRDKIKVLGREVKDTKEGYEITKL